MQKVWTWVGTWYLASDNLLGAKFTWQKGHGRRNQGRQFRSPTTGSAENVSNEMENKCYAGIRVRYGVKMKGKWWLI